MNDPTDWRRAVVANVLHAIGAENALRCSEMITEVLDESARAAFLAEYSDVAPGGPGAVDELVPAEIRRQAGIYFTPQALADRLAAAAISPGECGAVVDLSAGDGSLLAAVIRFAPGCAVRGVERELVFAVAAAARIVRLRRDPRDRIIWGDGLAPHRELEGAAAIVGNPPYVGEKGNRALFASLRRAHPDLGPWFGPRIDLHYLFLHRALDLLRPGGKLAYLTSEYWLTASGADILRGDLSSRAKSHTFEKLGAGAFVSAPGHHSLVFTAQRRTEPQPEDRRTWHPFATLARATDGLPLGDLSLDRQGFVSGADRVTNRLASVLHIERDRPIFIWHADELPENTEQFRPLLRAADCVANRVWRQPPGRDWVLWSDGSEGPVQTLELQRILEPFRPVLAARREAVTGAMPWHRIWWPRRAADYSQPKLVVPRRATTASMCLDLSGSFVSSDCTFLLAPDGVEPIPWLLRLMLAANASASIAQLRGYGKTKGEVMEFYAEPLRRWMLPLHAEGERLRLNDPALEAAAGAALVALQAGSAQTAAFLSIEL